MKKIIYILLFGFTCLSFSQGNYLMNTDDPNMVDIGSGFLGINLCVSQGSYTLTPIIINLNNPNEVAPTDLEYELIPISFANPIGENSFIGQNNIDLDALRIYLGMYNSQRRNIQFRIRVKALPNGHPYEQYSLVDRIFVITLSNDQPLTGDANQDITTDCGEQATVRDIDTNSSYNYITYYNSQGQIISSNTQVNAGDVITMYPKNSAVLGNNGGTCNIQSLQVTIGNITETNSEPYVGPKLGNSYVDLSVCDVDDELQIPLISLDSNQPLDYQDGQYRLWRTSPVGTMLLDNPVFNLDGSFSHFSIDLTSMFSSLVSDASYKIEYIPSNPTDGNGNPTQLCSPIYSNEFNINITNEFRNVSRSLDRVYFTDGLNDLDYDGVQEDELTYKAMFNLFMIGQQGVMDTTASPNGQGFLQYTGFTYIMYKDDGSGNKIQINNSDYDNMVTEFSDLLVNCDEVFYFKISSTCDDYHFDNASEEYKTLTIKLRDLITTYTNPDQYFCSIDNPTFDSLQLLAEGTGNPIYIWGSQFGNDLIFDPTQSNGGNTPLQNGDEFWIQEFGYPNAVCTNYYAEMFSSKRFYVKVHIVNNCSPDTKECPCNSFELEKGDKYIVSAWVKEDRQKQVITYQSAKVDVIFLQGDQVEQEFSFTPSGEIIEGWQRIVGEFFVPITATKVRIDLNNANSVIVGPPGPVDLSPYFDPLPPFKYPGVLREYEVTFVLDDFSNCDGKPTKKMVLRSGSELLPDTVYKLNVPNNTPPPFISPYILVSNPRIVRDQKAYSVSEIANVSCRELSELFTTSSPVKRVDAFYDDIRIHPFNGNMKSFVYDPITQRLMAELDENNYATMYEYDEEGGLIRVKKETEKGVFTIQETRSKSATKE
ncbi:hypothetical protein [Lacinutrix chionoecetis]